MNDDKIRPSHQHSSDVRHEPEPAYEAPAIVDYGTLRELTLSGTAPLSDMFGGAAGGGS